MTVAEFCQYCKDHCWEDERLFVAVTDQRDDSWNKFVVDEDRIAKTGSGIEVIAELTELTNGPELEGEERK